MKKIILLFLLVVSCFVSYSQMGLTMYTSGSVGLNTNTIKKLSIDAKFFLNSSLESMPMEMNVIYNFQPKTYHRFSCGVGANFSPFRGYDQMNYFVLPLSVELYPLQNLKQFSLVTEVAPLLTTNDDLALRYMFGLRYTFDKKSGQEK